MIRILFAALLAALSAVGAAAEEARAPLRPALFLAQDSDSKIYLFGTVHVRRPGAGWGGPEAVAALAEAEEFWTELEMSPQADARAAADAVRLGMALPGRPLSSYLSPDQHRRLQAALEAQGAPSNALEHMRPWFAGLMLSLMPVMRAGYDPDAGVDRQIDAAADAQGKRARWFETGAEQLAFFEGLSERVQVAMLMEAVDASSHSAAELGELERAWERGDLRTLERAVVDETRQHYPELYEILFVRRNRAWVEALMQEMEGEGVDFVAVGAGHLLGRDGLVEMLRARGVKVTRVRARS